MLLQLRQYLPPDFQKFVFADLAKLSILKKLGIVPMIFFLNLSQSLQQINCFVPCRQCSF